MTLIYQTCESAKQNPLIKRMAAIFQNGRRKIDATLIYAKMHVIDHVYTNLWCFKEQIIKKFMFIIVYYYLWKYA